MRPHWEILYSFHCGYYFSSGPSWCLKWLFRLMHWITYAQSPKFNWKIEEGFLCISHFQTALTKPSLEYLSSVVQMWKSNLELLTTWMTTQTVVILKEPKNSLWLSDCSFHDKIYMLNPFINSWLHIFRLASVVSYETPQETVAGNYLNSQILKTVLSSWKILRVNN